MPADDQSQNTTGYQEMDQEEIERRELLSRFLDVQFAAPGNQKIRQRMMDLLWLKAGDRVLDVGCALGGAIQEIASVVGADGQVTGLDLSEQALAEAERRAADLNLPVDWVVADAHDLPFADATFDAVRSERTFMHFADPRQALREVVRVTRPGGRIAVCDPDHRTWVEITGVPELYAKFSEYQSTVNPVGKVIGSQHPLLFQECGLDNISVEPRLLIVRSDDMIHGRQILGVKEPPWWYAAARDAGYLTDDEHDQLIADRDALIDSGLYCLTVTNFIVAGTVA